MIVIDTSALIRFFTNDDPTKAQAVKVLLNSPEIIFVPDVVFPELEYVLGDAYEANRQEIEETLCFLINRPNVKTNSTIKIALEIFKQTRLDLADCLIVAQAMGKKLASFDKEMLKSTGISPYWN
ncbi:MAG: PIN domain-containing protein [Candidatus Berkelbacteria bacterium]|nr:PIN domain-containing protein [Candidatus Berkelbacteria bacterium]